MRYLCETSGNRESLTCPATPIFVKGSDDAISVAEAMEIAFIDIPGLLRRNDTRILA
ncbi:MAG: hypothetical protein ACE5JU_18085 [Candidatus Binatia bacterium]